MKKSIYLTLALTLLFSIPSFAQQMTSEQYIAKYKTLAIESMIKYDIPASIKLAQGLIETASGNSRLAKEANNHFGIKCKSYWQGETISHDDDAKGECFRKYASAEESYADHSEFLTSSERYDALFSYAVTDYESWAKGLSTAGYATNPKYPLMLIKAIEDYELYLIDDEALELKKEYLAAKEREEAVPAKPEPKISTPVEVPAVVEQPISTSSEPETKQSLKQKAKEAKKASKANKKNTQVTKTSSNSLNVVSLPAMSSSSSSSSSPTANKNGFMSKVKSGLSVSNSGVAFLNNIYDGPKFDTNGYVKVQASPREVFKSNNVLFVVAKENDTFETIGNSLNISPSRLMGYNEVSGSNVRITAGSVVYISVKGTKVKNGYSSHTVEKGDNLHKISQIYGVKMANLAKINGYPLDYQLSVGQRVKLK
ncbi:MAG: glucosaminidase domain-containing protein [Rikenellaceae bacterium]